MIALMQGDCLKVMPTLLTSSVDITITSPPYNIGIDYDDYNDAITEAEYERLSYAWLIEVYRLTKSGGRLCLNLPVHSARNGWRYPTTAALTMIARKIGWKYNTTILWHKSGIASRTAWGSYGQATAPYVSTPFDSIIVLYKDEWKREKGESDITKEEFVAWTYGIWKIEQKGEDRDAEHPAAFPAELPRRLLKLYSFIGDTVLDPFTGSGTTLLECERNGRNAIGIELSRVYFEAAQWRLEQDRNRPRTMEMAL